MLSPFLNINNELINKSLLVFIIDDFVIIFPI